MPISEKMKASTELIEAYEELRSMVLCTKGRCVKFFHCSAALFEKGGMAEFIVCSSEVFSARSDTEKPEAREAFLPLVICQELKSELTDILTDIALSNVCMELNV